jgi:trafficking protein particle complex subunit 3
MDEQQQISNTLWQKQQKVNAEFFSLTYGALIQELCHDMEDDAASMQQTLETMGHSMGLRSLEELLAKSAVLQLPPLGSTSDDAEDSGLSQAMATVKIAFKVFFGINVETKRLTTSASEDAEPSKTTAGYAINFTDNPLAIFVALPEDESERPRFEYCELLCGWVRGLLEALAFDCTCRMESSMLKSADRYQISVLLNQVIREGAGADYHEE